MQKLKLPFYQTAVVFLLVLINLVLIVFLLLADNQVEADNTQQPHHFIQRLYIPSDLGSLQPMMEVMTVHGSIQYYADDSDWLYFEQMAGSLSITLDSNVQAVNYWNYEENHIQYSCITGKLGSELVWEDENGYMFYLYSSLNIDQLIDISKNLVCREEAVT